MNTSTNEDARKSAYADILKLGPKAISAVSDFNSDPKNYVENPTYVGEYTIDNLVGEIHSANNLEEGAEIDDVVTIDGQYTMGGTFAFPKNGY